MRIVKFSCFLLFMFFKIQNVLAGLPTQQTPLLGHGYDEETEQVLSQVVKSRDEPKFLYAGQQESTLQIKQDVSFEELLADLNVKTAAGFSLGIFSISGGVDFVSTIAKTSLSSNVVYFFDVKGKSAMLNGASFTDIAVALIQSRHAENKEKFFSKHFVSRVDLGGKLVAGITMNFVNKDAKSAFHANFKMDLLDFLKANAEGGVKNDQLAASASINISAKQIGGDPTRLSEIFRNANNGDIPVVSCNLKDLKPCFETVKAIISYGQSFGEQLKNLEYNPSSASGSAILGSGVSAYSRYGLNEVDQNPSLAELKEIKDRREYLIRRYLQFAKDRQSIDRLLDLQPSTQERKRLEELRRKIEISITDALNTIDTCYHSPGGCLEAGKKLELFSYSSDEIQFQWTFFNYCEFVKDSLPIAATVERIRQIFPDGNHMTCAEIQSELEEKKFLDLSFSVEKDVKPISDLSPLSGLTKLRKIKLDNNRVNNLKPLETNLGLEIFSLKGNAFTQFPKLCAFSRLKHLDLEFNRKMEIEGEFDIDCIDKLRSLEFLNVRGAQFENKKSVSSFVQIVEEHTKAKRFVSFFTSTTDVCEAYIRWQEKSGKLTEESSMFCRKEGFVFDANDIGIPCSDKVQLPVED